MKLKQLILSIILGLCCFTFTYSQSTWATPLQQNSYESISELPDGDFLVLGRRRLGMINATGKVQWEKEYAQSIYESKLAGDTTVYVTGQDEKNNFWAAEMGVHGSILWEKTMPHLWGSGSFIEVTPSGNIIFAGGTKVSDSFLGGDTQMFVYCSSNTGDSLWSWMSNSINSEGISSIELINDTTLAFLGSDGNFYSWFRKINLNTGAIVFEKSDNHKSASGILKQATDTSYVLLTRTQHPDGHLYVQTSFCHTDTLLNHSDTVSFGKINTTTHSGWQTLIAHPDNTYFIATSTLKESDDEDSDILLLRVNYEGDTLWTRTYSTDDNWEYTNDAVLCLDGGYGVLGMFDGAAHVLKTDEMGIALITSSADLHEINSQQVVAYPNPVADKLYINNSEKPIHQYDIYSTDGKRIKTAINRSVNLAIDFSGFNSGIYWVKVYMEQEVQTIKVIKN